MGDLRVLVIDTSEATVDALAIDALQGPCKVVVERADTAAAVEESLHWFEPDLVLSEWTLPDLDGWQALALVRRLRPEVPFVFVTQVSDDSLELEAFRHGATDCVSRVQGARIVATIRRSLDQALERKKHRHAQKALQESEIRFRLFMDHMPGAVYMKDLDGRITFVNTAAALIIGRPAAELLGRKLSQIYPAEIAAQFAENDARALMVRQPVQVVEQALTPDGMRTFLSVKFPVAGLDGHAEMVGGVSLDVTQRRLEERQLLRFRRMHSVMLTIADATTRIHSRDGLLQEVCRIAVEDGQFRMAWIGLADAGHSKVTPVAWHGIDDGYLDEVGKLLETETEERYLTGWSVHVEAWDSGVAAEAARSGESIVCNDIESDPRVLFRPQALARGYRSMAAFPLKLQGHAIGMLMLFAGEAAAFDNSEVDWLQMLAANLSLALTCQDQAARISFASLHDPLTGLPSRSRFVDLVSCMIREGASKVERVSLLLFDLRGFGDLNLRFGRDAGDLVLRTFSGRLKTVFGGIGVVARMAADHFAAAIPEADAASLAILAEDRMDGRLTEPMFVRGVELRINFKLGISSAHCCDASVERLLQNAEEALRLAKQGEEAYIIHSAQVHAIVEGRRELEARLRDAVVNRAFVLHYQPKVDLATRAVVGVEALIRWRDGKLGLVAPDEFIPVLERADLIAEVGQWAFNEAAMSIRRWAACGLEPPRVSLNVSALQLRRPDFLGKLLAAVGGPLEAGAHIDIEITESAWSRGFEIVRERLQELRALGVGIIVDDFGTGGSSLSMLAQLPVTVVKIDRSLVLELDRRPAARAIVAGIVGMAKALGLVTLAEGLESEKATRQLQELGCEQGQGFHFSAPRSATEIAHWLQSGNSLGTGRGQPQGLRADETTSGREPTARQSRK